MRQIGYMGILLLLAVMQGQTTQPAEPEWTTLDRHTLETMAKQDWAKMAALKNALKESETQCNLLQNENKILHEQLEAGKKQIAKPLVLPKTASAEEVGKQPKRLEFIQDLISKGFFFKTKGGGGNLYADLWVGPRFYDVDIDTKSNFVNVVFAYYFTENSNCQTIYLYDSKTGKEIGKYNPFYGGLDLY